MSDSARIETVVRHSVEAHSHRVGALFPVLLEVQRTLGHIPSEAIPLLARSLNLSRAEIQGVIGFYHDFTTRPGGKHQVHICRAEACQAVGARQLEQHAARRLGAGYGETTADGKITLQPVYCLGNCACGPSIRIDDDVHARVDPDRFDELVSELVGGGE